MHDPLVCSTTRPIDAFYRSFCEMKNVQKALRGQFGKRAPEVLAKLRAGEELGKDKDYVDDEINDLILGESKDVDSIPAWGDQEEFHIRIRQFGDAYWVSEVEFDPVGLFATIDDAQSFAQEHFSSFIEALDGRDS